MKTKRAMVAVAAATAIAGVVLLACSGGKSGGGGEAVSCPASFDYACDAGTPSWSTEVEPLFEQYCNSCHTDGGIGQASFNASSYNSVFGGRAEIAVQVGTCLMPEPDASPPPPLPTDAERQTIVSWVACGAPNN